MRTNDVLVNGFDNMKTLFQYLYMNEEHYVEVVNTIDVKLRITMNDKGVFYILNTNFPDIPAHPDKDWMDVETCMAIVQQLEQQEPLMKNTAFKSRWDEVKTITKSTVFMNSEKIRR